jgi:EmrB/QacA subfamily drug resistance transporter
VAVSDDSRAGGAGGGSWVVPLLVLVSGTFMAVLDTSITNVAIPKMMVALNAPPDDVEWIVTAYTLMMGVVVPVCGWLGSRFGLARLHRWAMLGFAATSALCGLAWSLPSMIVFRVLQAVPGGMLPLIAMILLMRIVPKSNIGAAMGIYGLGVTVAPAVGPVLGGYLVEYVDWRLIFYINVPVGILGAAAAAVILPSEKPISWPKFDLWGFLTVGYGMFALLLACAEGQKWGWTGYRILGLFVTGTLSLALFVVIELEVPNPLVNLKVLTYWPFVNSLLLLVVVMTGMFTGLYFIPQYLQNVQGMQAFNAGLVLLPASLVVLVMMPIAGRIYDAVGPRWPVTIGMLIAAYASYQLAQMNVETPRHFIEVNLAIRNFGLGLSMMPIMTAGLAALPTALSGAGSTMNNVMRQVISSVSVAALTGMNTDSAQQLMADRGALYDSGAQMLPQIAAYQEQGPSGMLGLYTMLNNEITTQTYANGFYLVAVMSLASVGLTLALRSGGNSTAKAAKPEIVEV